jgi:hypothetical protein
MPIPDIAPNHRVLIALGLDRVGLYLDSGAKSVVEVLHEKRKVLVYRPEPELAEEVVDKVVWPFAADFQQIFAGL